MTEYEKSPKDPFKIESAIETLKERRRSTLRRPSASDSKSGIIFRKGGEEAEKLVEESANVFLEKFVSSRDDDFWFIKKSDWDKLANFFGTRMKSIFHPHFAWLWNEGVKRWKPTSENLILMSCSGQKPYSENYKFKPFIDFGKSTGKADLITVSSPYPVLLHPVDTSTQYPNLFYEFPHVESDELSSMMIQLNVQSLSYMIGMFGYKRVILVSILIPYYSEIIRKLRILHPDVEFFHPSNSMAVDASLPTFNFNTGLVSQRVNSMIPTKLCVYALLDSIETIFEQKRKKNWKDIITNQFKTIGVDDILSCSKEFFEEICNDVKNPSICFKDGGYPFSLGEIKARFEEKYGDLYKSLKVKRP